MKKIITSKVENGTIEVSIKINGHKYLSSNESRRALDCLTDGVIKSLCETPYFGNYVHKVKVK